MTSTPSLEAERADLVRALAVLSERPGAGTGAVAAALGLPLPDPVAYTELFVHQLPPYASIYLGEGGKIGGGARDRIAGFWRAVGVAPPTEPDHLATLLGLWARLLGEAVDGDGAGRALALHAGRVLVREHLRSWLVPYLLRVEELAEPPYPAWAGVLRTLVETDDHNLGTPVHLAGEPAPPSGPDDLIPFLLAPVRSGFILTRSDLTRAATDLGLGSRIGERAFALRALVSQAPRRVTGWIAVEARRQAARIGDAGSVRAAWSIRARDTASILEELAGTGA